ncbi:MAG: hypothetical protein IJJ69_10700 [Oscillospiraceae bacterium]|nr:hypothetical protein [Oscillospiraceae bacterium]
MSRSYKKFPVHKDRARTSKDREKPKTYANRAVRRSNGIPEGKAGYKKLYCSWIICDYRFYDCRNETEFKVLWKKGHSPVVRRYLCRSLERLEKI